MAEEKSTARRIDDVIRIGRMRHEAQQREIEKQFGLGRAPISFESNGYKIVAVGSELHWSKTWRTFPDFLMSYFKKIMGADWGSAQLAKPRENWSPIFDWYARTCEYQKKMLSGSEPQQTPMTGAACGTLWLTYGLYLLRHNAEIQERLLARLRSDDPVQIYAAVQEVLCAAAIIRAGFELKLEDESDGSTTHCEFVATSKITGKSFSVEIKACDPARPVAKKGKSRTIRQLSKALSKVAAHPRLIWIDLNRPPAPDQTPAQVNTMLIGENRRIQTQAPNLRINGGAAPPAYVILSNWPFRHQLDETTAIRRAGILTGIGIQKLGENVAFHSLRELAEFRDEHQDMFRLAKEFAGMGIPDTLDGSLPSVAFGKEGNRIRIGDRYVVPGPDGSDQAGEILGAHVMESEKAATAVVRLDDGTTSIYKMPLTDDDLAIYRDSPETFFGDYQPQNRVDHPVELYEWLLKTYRNTPRERLLEFLKSHRDIEKLKTVSTDELAKIYTEGIANSMASRVKWNPEAK